MKKILCILILTGNFVSCGKTSTPAAVTATTTTSTSTTTDSTTTAQLAQDAFPSGLAISSTFSSTTTAGMPLNTRKIGVRAFDSSLNYTDKKAALATVIAAASDEACQITLPTISAPSNGPSCYGPDLDYSNHIDATNVDGDDLATQAFDMNSDDGRLPTGDLGIMSSTHTDTGEACTAAKMNSLMDNATDKIDSAVFLAAAVNCVMQRTSQSLPEISASLDLTSAVQTAIAVNNASTTISTATISRADDIDGDAVYVYTIYGSNTSNIDFQFTIKHKQNETDGSAYTGKVYASIEGINGGAFDSTAYSLLYDQTATNLNYQMLSAGYNKNSEDAHPSELFDSSNNIDITATQFNASYTQTLANIVSETGYGNMSYSWQAGSGDRATRVFNAFTSADEGCGFFGFGDSFNISTGAIPDNLISEFICNWAGPGNNPNSGVTGVAQKQCMTKSSGSYVVNSAKENIAYSPNNSCSFNGSAQNSSSREYNWGIASSTGPNDFSSFATNYTTGSAHSAVTNNLVTLSTDTDYANFTNPTAPTDPF